MLDPHFTEQLTAGLRWLVSWHIVSLPLLSVVPKSQAVGLIAWGVPPVSQEGPGRLSASQELSGFVLKIVLDRKGTGETLTR